MSKTGTLSDKVVRPGRAGKPRRKPRRTRKGRQVDPSARAAISTLLGDRPRRRDLLIEYLHLIQDAHGHLSAAHLAALAGELKLSQAEVYEVATFYHHFDVVKEGEAAPPPVTIRVCDSLTCAMMGADALLEELRRTCGDTVRVVRAPCMGLCDAAPAAAVGQNHIAPAGADVLNAAAASGHTAAALPDCQGYTGYLGEGGYVALNQCRTGALSVDRILDDLEQAGLKGLGGAGFPAAQKWKFVRAEAAPRYLCVNADEGEPGTFKDRYYLKSRPHQFLEGALIAAWAVEAARIVIYLRDEYPGIRQVLAREIAALEGDGLIEEGMIDLRRGAGAYICGEESAMIESIEGKRGLPRHRPPYVAQNGLYGRATLVHNVETLYWMPEILTRGPQWFSDQGKDGHKGVRSYSVSGRVANPGVVQAPAGSSAEELIERCGGMAAGHSFRAYLPGGASGGILPASLGNLPLDFGTLEEHGSFVGSHAVVILSQSDRLKDAALNLLTFFADESCGQYTPCRVGCEKAVTLMEADNWDRRLLEELCAAMADASICGLGQAAPNPIRSVLKFFAEEI